MSEQPQDSSSTPPRSNGPSQDVRRLALGTPRESGRKESQIDPAARLPPQDLDAERAVLGSMMLDRDAAGLVLQIIPREEPYRFYLPAHAKLFMVLVDIYDNAGAMDLVVVRDELERRKVLEELGGVDFLIELVESIPSAVHCEHYARIVRDKSLLRDVIRCAGEITEMAYDGGGSAQQVLDESEKALFEITQKRIRNPAVQVRDLLADVYKYLDAPGASHITGVPSGFIELDELTGGFQPGELIIVAARPSMGKTALGLSVAEHVSVTEGRPLVFYSMEMSRQQIVFRLLCARGRINSHQLRKHMIRQSDVDSVHAVAADLQNAPLFIDDTPGMSLMELRAKARRLMVSQKIEMIIVDYLQLMSDPRAARESRQHEIATISRGLKALGRELKIPVIALAQVNRNPEGREGNRPRMSDLRESGAIEQDADVIILLHREEYYLRDRIRRLASDGEDEAAPAPVESGGRKRPRKEDLQKQYEAVKNQAELIVAKQRNGPTGTVVIRFDQDYTRFDNFGHGAEPDFVPRTDEPYIRIPADAVEVTGDAAPDTPFNSEGPGEADESDDEGGTPF